MGVQWMMHNGMSFLSVDYRNCKHEEEMIRIFEEQVTQMQQVRISGGKTLVLSNFEGTAVGSKFMKRIKDVGREHGKKSLAKNAILGINGLKRVLLNAYIAYTGLNNIKAFDSISEALDWLVGQ